MKNLFQSMASVLILFTIMGCQASGYNPPEYADHSMVFSDNPVKGDIVNVSHLSAVDRIVVYGTRDNRVMEHLDHLVNGFGSRSCCSENLENACIWARDSFKDFGLTSPRLEECGEYRAGSFFTGYRKTILYNVVADIPGTRYPDQYVIISAHIDTRNGSSGIADNSVGVAAVMEAARILAQSGIRPLRTIRFVLFSGEESGLYGSRKYLTNHPELHERISGVFNMDAGTGYISGIHGTASLFDDLETVFSSLKTLKDQKPFTVEKVRFLPETVPGCCDSPKTASGSSSEDQESCESKCSSSGADCCPNIFKKIFSVFFKSVGCCPPKYTSDHASFLAYGIPAFTWIQKDGNSEDNRMEKRSDITNIVNPSFLKHSATVIALGAYGTADLDHMLSRKDVVNPAEGDDKSGSKKCGGVI